jgi:hypothetical protein
MRTPVNPKKLICALFLLAAWLCPAHAAETNPYADPAWLSRKGTASGLEAYKVHVLEAYFWRDWMPIVGHPGPDRGSPLHAKVKLSLENSTGGTAELSFQAIMVDDRGQSYPITFRALPNYGVLPDTVIKSYRTSDDETKKSVTPRYTMAWNGELKPGEVREVELIAADGPYLPVGSRVHAEIRVTDRKGGSVMVRTPDAPINRTD